MIQTNFATVQWARKMTQLAQSFANNPPTDLQKLNNFLTKFIDFREAEGDVSEQQLQVIMQALHTKELVKLETVKGGISVEFTGGGLDYERFLIRADGKVPNNRYESKKAE